MVNKKLMMLLDAVSSVASAVSRAMLMFNCVEFILSPQVSGLRLMSNNVHLNFDRNLKMKKRISLPRSDQAQQLN